MGYVVTNGNAFLRIERPGEVKKVVDYQLATVFITKEAAEWAKQNNNKGSQSSRAKYKIFPDTVLEESRIKKELKKQNQERTRQAQEAAKAKKAAQAEIAEKLEKAVKKQLETAEEKTTQKTQRIIFSKEVRTAIYNKYEGRCGICGRFVPCDSFTIDHIVPLAKGGKNDTENLQCACRTCNTMKQDILPEDLMEHLLKILKYQMEKCYDGSNVKGTDAISRKKWNKQMAKRIQQIEDVIVGKRVP